MDQDPCVEKLAAQVTSAAEDDDVNGAFDVVVRMEDDRSCQTTPQKPTQSFAELIDIIIAAYSGEIEPHLAPESLSIILKARIGIEPANVPMMHEASRFPFTAFGESTTSVIPEKENSAKKRLPAGIVSVIWPWH